MKLVVINDDKTYHTEGEVSEFTSGIEISDKRPKKYDHDALPTTMYGNRDLGSLGEPAEWIKVKLVGSDEVYLTPAYRINRQGDNSDVAIGSTSHLVSGLYDLVRKPYMNHGQGKIIYQHIDQDGELGPKKTINVYSDHLYLLFDKYYQGDDYEGSRDQLLDSLFTDNPNYDLSVFRDGGYSSKEEQIEDTKRIIRELYKPQDLAYLEFQNLDTIFFEYPNFYNSKPYKDKSGRITTTDPEQVIDFIDFRLDYKVRNLVRFDQHLNRSVLKINYSGYDSITDNEVASHTLTIHESIDLSIDSEVNPVPYAERSVIDYRGELSLPQLINYDLSSPYGRVSTTFPDGYYVRTNIYNQAYSGSPKVPEEYRGGLNNVFLPYFGVFDKDKDYRGYDSDRLFTASPVTYTSVLPNSTFDNKCLIDNQIRDMGYQVRRLKDIGPYPTIEDLDTKLATTEDGTIRPCIIYAYSGDLYRHPYKIDKDATDEDLYYRYSEVYSNHFWNFNVIAQVLFDWDNVLEFLHRTGLSDLPGFSQLYDKLNSQWNDPDPEVKWRIRRFSFFTEPGSLLGVLNDINQLFLIYLTLEMKDKFDGRSADNPFTKSILSTIINLPEDEIPDELLDKFNEDLPSSEDLNNYRMTPDSYDTYTESLISTMIGPYPEMTESSFALGYSYLSSLASLSRSDAGDSDSSILGKIRKMTNNLSYEPIDYYCRLSPLLDNIAALYQFVGHPKYESIHSLRRDQGYKDKFIR